MNDLLTEEEFLPKPFKPWRWFVKFYFVTALILGFLTYINCNTYLKNETFKEITEFFSAFIAPVLLSILMIFLKKERLSEISLVAYGVALLISIHSLCFTIYIFDFIRPLKDFIPFSAEKIIVAILKVFVINYSFSMLIILPIVKRSRKVRNRILSMQGADKKNI